MASTMVIIGIIITTKSKIILNTNIILKDLLFYFIIILSLWIMVIIDVINIINILTIVGIYLLYIYISLLMCQDEKNVKKKKSSVR